MLEEEMEQVMKDEDEDEETRRELEIEARRMQKEIERLKNDAERFALDRMERIGPNPTQLELEEPVRGRRKEYPHRGLDDRRGR